MNFFESIGTVNKNVENTEQNNPESKGLEGICTTCEGKGKVRPGFLKEKRVCGDCHGKGFVKKDEVALKGSYDWNTGKLH